MKNDIHDYSDIINLPHFNPKRHSRMDKNIRCSEFSPFAALSGYGDAINEAGIVLEKRKILTNEEKENLDLVLNYLKNNMDKEIAVIYYVADLKKDGGKYVSKSGVLRKINDTSFELEFFDKTIIKIKDIYKIICLEYDII